MTATVRHCFIESASIENESGQGDGAYDLIDVEGTPEEIGAAITAALRETDLHGGVECPSHIEAGEALFLSLRIKVRATK